MFVLKVIEPVYAKSAAPILFALMNEAILRFRVGLQKRSELNNETCTRF